jgi:hypothetical protein
MAQLTQANAALAARIPELEASATQEPAESPQTVEETSDRSEPLPLPDYARCSRCSLKRSVLRVDIPESFNVQLSKPATSKECPTGLREV